jgi:hypothetical protein
MLIVGSASGEGDALGAQFRDRPTGRGSFGIPDIGGGWGVDDMNPFVLSITTMVNVSVDIRFYLFTRCQDFP